MALFTDVAVITLDDLLQFEASLGQVASSHGINVDNKISLATSAISDKLMLWLHTDRASTPTTFGQASIGPANVVMTQPLYRWLVYESLARVFAEAYNVQLNTRFQSKWVEYQGEAKNASDSFFRSGAGVVSNPLPRPGMPLVSLQSGNIPAQAVFVKVAWVNAAGGEGALSAANGVVLPDSSSIAVGMTEGALGAPAAATGWNVYASGQAQALSRQNVLPLSIGSTWQLPTSGLVVGEVASGGQRPDYYIKFSRDLQRG